MAIVGIDAFVFFFVVVVLISVSIPAASAFRLEEKGRTSPIYTLLCTRVYIYKYTDTDICTHAYVRT